MSAPVHYLIHFDCIIKYVFTKYSHKRFHANVILSGHKRVAQKQKTVRIFKGFYVG